MRTNSLNVLISGKSTWGRYSCWRAIKDDGWRPNQRGGRPRRCHTGCQDSRLNGRSLFIEGKFLFWIKPPFMPHTVISLKTVTVQFCVYLES